MAEVIFPATALLLYFSGFFLKKSKIKSLYSFTADLAIFFILLAVGIKPEITFVFLVFSSVLSGLFAIELPQAESIPKPAAFLPPLFAGCALLYAFYILFHSGNSAGQGNPGLNKVLVPFLIFFIVFSTAGYFIVRGAKGGQDGE